MRVLQKSLSWSMEKQRLSSVKNTCLTPLTRGIERISSTTMQPDAFLPVEVCRSRRIHTEMGSPSLHERGISSLVNSVGS